VHSGWPQHALRRILPVVLVVLALSGCSSSLGIWSAPSTAVHHKISEITVSGGTDKQPTVNVPTPFSVAETARTIIAQGDGAAVAQGQRVTVNYVGINGTDGQQFDSSWTRSPASFVVGVGDYVMKGVVQGLIGVPIGSRVLVAVPAKDAYGVSGAADRSIGPTDTIIFVMDIESARAVLTRATGTAVTPDKTLPKVKLDKDGKPILTISGSPPSRLVVQPLIKGKGLPVKKGQQITVQYVGEVWSTGKIFDSSWDRKAPSTFTIGTGEVLAGWDRGLVGQPVGSQVMLILPPDMGYGALGRPDIGIKGPDALICVVDILDAA
jgi:peptidylprolyl isomerase